TARAAPRPAAGRPRITALLLAAGSSRRMGGRDKLIEDVAGQPMIAATARALAASGADEVLVVLRPGDTARRAALSGVERLRVIENPRSAAGMGTSLACAIRAVSAEADGALIALADMPDLTAADHDRLMAAFDPAEGREIVRALGADGTPGHPVLFGRRFFEPLSLLEGDEGARGLLREHRDFVAEVRLAGRRALVDLDTPEALQAWRDRHRGETLPESVDT
ncbi:MAG: nucleotidyltransferase family protein, partial [Pseudomonadota bacterium]